MNLLMDTQSSNYSYYVTVRHTMLLTNEEVQSCNKVDKVRAEFRQAGDKSAFIFKEVINRVDIAAIFWNKPGKLKLPFSFSDDEANRADVFTYKRKRNNFAPRFLLFI